MTRVRPLYWSIRRELWEHRALWIAPLAVEAVVLLAYFVSSFTLPHGVAVAQTGQQLRLPYAVAAGAIFTISFFVAVFYALGALHNDRRDRSLLFWKSLPVSDLTTVLSKAAIPLVVQPLIVLGIAVAAQLVMLIWGTIVVGLSGQSLSVYWSHLHLPLIWVLLPYGLVMNALWDLPFYGWLLLVSAWARRATFVWAVAPWLMLMLVEFMFMGGKAGGPIATIIGDRVFGGFNRAYTVVGQKNVAVTSLAQVDPVRFFGDPGFWAGLFVGAAFLAGCVWLRRRQDPL
jgi:ABC-2 type transport system permease protein